MGNKTIVDLDGKWFGRLFVVGVTSRRLRDGCRERACICECGKFCYASPKGLSSGHKMSCGCLVKENGGAPIHGMNKTPTHRVWVGMRSRCSNPRCKDFKWYGAKGVKVCKRWQKFENFLADMGERPKGKSIDRINVKGNYSPKNCRWATVFEQANNKRGK